MKLKFAIYSIAILIGFVLAAGCSSPLSPPPTPTPTTIPTTVPPTTPVPITTIVPTTTTISLTPEPTVTLPGEYETNMQVTQDDIMRLIFVRFNGGKSQNWLQRIDVRVVTNSGKIIEKNVTRDAGPIPTGPLFEFQGERGTNRVEVTVIIIGVSYKIIDQNVFFR